MVFSRHLNYICNEYYLRDQTLEWLGFDSYKQYLRSSLWKDIRSRLIKDEDNECAACGAKSLKSKQAQIHHYHYDESNLSGKSLDGLLVLCKSCHVRIEFFGKGVKRTLAQANGVLSSIIADRATEKKHKRRPHRTRQQQDEIRARNNKKNTRERRKKGKGYSNPKKLEQYKNSERRAVQAARHEALNEEMQQKIDLEDFKEETRKK